MNSTNFEASRCAVLCFIFLSLSFRFYLQTFFKHAEYDFPPQGESFHPRVTGKAVVVNEDFPINALPIFK